MVEMSTQLVIKRGQDGADVPMGDRQHTTMGQCTFYRKTAALNSGQAYGTV